LRRKLKQIKTKNKKAAKKKAHDLDLLDPARLLG
jgi:hypothetical protein